jgi:hypothetical protein
MRLWCGFKANHRRLRCDGDLISKHFQNVWQALVDESKAIVQRLNSDCEVDSKIFLWNRTAISKGSWGEWIAALERLCSDCAEIVQRSDYVEFAKRLCSDCASIVHRLCIDCAAIVHRLCIDCASIVQRLYSDCEAIVQRLCKDCASIVQR